MIGKIWKKWIKFGEWLGDKISLIVLSMIYFVIMLPLSIFYKFEKKEEGWIKIKEENDESSQF